VNIITEEIIDKYFDNIYWIPLIKYNKLNEKIIDKYLPRINFTQIPKLVLCNYISQYQDLSETFIRNHINEINFNLISQYQKLSETFMEEFIDKLNIFYLWKYQDLSIEFIKKHNINFLTIDEIILKKNY